MLFIPHLARNSCAYSKEKIGKTLRGAMGAMKAVSVGVERVVESEEAQYFEKINEMRDCRKGWPFLFHATNNKGITFKKHILFKICIIT